MAVNARGCSSVCTSHLADALLPVDTAEEEQTQGLQETAQRCLPANRGTGPFQMEDKLTPSAHRKSHPPSSHQMLRIGCVDPTPETLKALECIRDTDSVMTGSWKY